MASYSDYYQTVHHILTSFNARDINRFKALNSDNDRVEFLLRKHNLDIFSVEPTFYPKSSGEAKQHREQGNFLYKKKDYQASLEHYNQAVLVAPWPRYIDVTEDLDTGSPGGEGPAGTRPFSPDDPSPSMPWGLRRLSYNLSTSIESPTSSPVKTPKNVPKLGTRQFSIVVNEATDGTMSEEAENKELALALGNRSALLYQLGRYVECMADIDSALLLGFPRHLRYKLFDRKGRCCFECQQFSEALDYFRMELDILEHSSLTAKQMDKLTDVCREHIEQCNTELSKIPARPSISELDPTPAYRKMPTLGLASKRFPCASEQFNVCYAKNKGRYAVSTRNIGIGEVILGEKPLAAVLDRKFINRRCYHCFETLPCNPFPCQNCSSVKFCSNRCRLDAWEAFHRWECHYLELLVSSGTGQLAMLALRIILVAGWTEIAKVVGRAKPEAASQITKSVITNSDGVYVGGFTGVYSLLPHSANRDVNELLQFSLLALFILKILKFSEFMEDINSLNIKDKKKLQEQGDLDVLMGGLILRLIQIIACNGIEVTEMSVSDSLMQCHPESIGLGVYPTVSFINHSCDPMMELLFYGKTCTARAIHNIKENKELTIDYGYLYYTSPREQRQVHLRAQYHFLCQCDPCTFDWPLKSRLPDGAAPLKCRDCKQPIRVRGTDVAETHCGECGSLQNTASAYQTLRSSSRQCDMVVEKAKNFQVLYAIPALESHLTLLDHYVALPWKEYTVSTSVLKQCYRLLANSSRDAVVKSESRLDSDSD